MSGYIPQYQQVLLDAAKARIEKEKKYVAAVKKRSDQIQEEGALDDFLAKSRRGLSRGTQLF